MKFIWIIASLIVLNSCFVLVGNRNIYSPKSSTGEEFRSKDIHFKVTNSSPPDLIFLTIDGVDSTSILIGSEAIDNKTNWLGVLLPVFPAFIIPRRTVQTDTLTLFAVLTSTKNLQFNNSSFVIFSEGLSYEPIRMSFNEEPIEEVNFNGEHYDPFLPFFQIPIIYRDNLIRLDFKIDLEQMDSFELSFKEIVSDNKIVSLPTVTFSKEKQRWRVIGP